MPLSRLGAGITPQERSEIARNAVKARWEKAGKTVADIPVSPPPAPELDVVAAEEMPYSLFQGTLTIGNLELECHVLNDLRRVFTQREIVRIISGGRDSGNIQRYLDGNSLIANDFRAGRTISFRIPGQPTIAIGWEATGLHRYGRFQSKVRQALQKSYAATSLFTLVLHNGR